MVMPTLSPTEVLEWDKWEDLIGPKDNDNKKYPTPEEERMQDTLAEIREERRETE